MIHRLYTVLVSPLILLAITSLVLFGVSLQAGMQPDEGFWMYAGKQWSVSNIVPYTGVCDTAQPGILMLFALGYRLFGAGIWWLRIMTIIAILATQWCIYAVVVKIQSKQAGVIAMTVFGIAMSWANMDTGLKISPDMFMILFSVGSLLFIIKAFSLTLRRSFIAMMCAAGLCLGAALLFKQTALLTIAAMLLVYFGLHRSRQSPVSHPPRDIPILIVCSLLPLLMFLLALSMQGMHLTDYLYCAWLSLFGRLPASWFEWGQAYLHTFQRTDCIVLYPFVVLYLMIYRHVTWKQPVGRLLIILLISETAAVMIWGLFSDVEFTQLIPIYAIAVGISIRYVTGLLTDFETAMKSALMWTLVLIILIGMPYKTLYMVKKRGILMRRNIYYSFGQWIAEQTKPGDTLFVYGDWAGMLYVYAQRTGPSRFVRPGHLDIPDRASAVLSSLESDPPAMVLVPTTEPVPEWITEFLKDGYKRVIYNQSWIKRYAGIYQREGD